MIYFLKNRVVKDPFVVKNITGRWLQMNHLMEAASRTLFARFSQRGPQEY